MVVRVRHPGCPPKDIDLGPAQGRLQPTLAMRRPLDEAIVFAALRGHNLGRKPA